MKKVVVTGASGLLGRAVVSEFSKNSWVVLGLALTRANDQLVKVDLTDTNEVHKTIRRFKPNAIIHCAAERSPDKVEGHYEETRILNVTVSKTLAELACAMNVAFIYISSDYVFDGKDPPYNENDEPNPINKYGITKFEGEIEVMSYYPGSCILRIPVLYGGDCFIGESAVSSLIKILMDEKPSQVSSYEIRFPSHTSDIAKICLQLTEKKLETPSLNSIFHWCGSESFTKYEMMAVMAEEFDLPHVHISADKKQPVFGAARPQNTQLSCERLLGLGIGHHTPFRTGIQDFKKFIILS